MAAAEIIGAIGSAVGGAAAAASAGNSIGASVKSKRKMKFAAALNHKYSEMAAEAAYKRQMEMYERVYQDESYQNRVKQMREAGLSVGLMYGQGAQGGGAGATTGAPAGNTNQNIDPGLGAAAAENANVTRGGLALVEASRNIAQVKNIESQTDLNEAAAKKAEADAAAARENAGLTAEKKITEMQTRDALIQKLRSEGALNEADAKLKNAERELTGVDTALKKIDLEVKESTKEWKKSEIRDQAQKAHEDLLYAIEQVNQSKVDTEVKQRTKETVIKTYYAEMKRIQSEYVKNIAGALLSEQQIELVYQQAWGTWWENNHKGNRIAIETALKRADQELEAMRIDVEDRRTIVSALSNILGSFGGAMILRGPENKSKGTKTLVWGDTYDNAYPWHEFGD